jgi:hypothetical protein
MLGYQKVQEPDAGSHDKDEKGHYFGISDVLDFLET